VEIFFKALKMGVTNRGASNDAVVSKRCVVVSVLGERAMRLPVTACEEREEGLRLDSRLIGKNDGSCAKFNHGQSGALMVLSDKGRQMIDIYSAMARDGHRTIDNQVIEHAFNDMEIRAFREPARTVRRRHSPKTGSARCSQGRRRYQELQHRIRNHAQKQASWEAPVI